MRTATVTVGLSLALTLSSCTAGGIPEESLGDICGAEVVHANGASMSGWVVYTEDFVCDVRRTGGNFTVEKTYYKDAMQESLSGIEKESNNE